MSRSLQLADVLSRIDTSQHRRLKLTIVCLGQVRRHKFSMTNLAASFANLGIICCAALSSLFFFNRCSPVPFQKICSFTAQSVVAESLASRRGPCCSVADGQSVKNVDWDTKDGKYRVRLDGQWIRGPDRRSGNCAKQVRAGRGSGPTRTMKAGRRSGASFLERAGNEFSSCSSRIGVT